MGPDAAAMAWEARRLLRGARSAVLATSDQGHPHAALVTPACLPDLSILLFLSDLSAHTRHLRADPRCALLVQGVASGVNPQTAPRTSLVCTASLDPDPAGRARWLDIHPYAAQYAGFTDFHLWRLEVAAAHHVGGFGRAARLGRALLMPEAGARAAIAAAASDIMAACAPGDAAALARLAAGSGLVESGLAEGWRLIGIDPDGCDISDGTQVLRADWPAPVGDAAGVRAALAGLVAAAPPPP